MPEEHELPEPSDAPPLPPWGPSVSLEELIERELEESDEIDDEDSPPN